MNAAAVQCGRHIKTEELEQIRETVETFQRLSQSEIAQTVCEHLGWHTASGANKVDACRKLLKRLEAKGLISLPGKRDCPPRICKQPVTTSKTRPQEPVVGTLSDIEPVRLRVVRDKQETALFNEYLRLNRCRGKRWRVGKSGLETQTYSSAFFIDASAQWGARST